MSNDMKNIIKSAINSGALNKDDVLDTLLEITPSERLMAEPRLALSFKGIDGRVALVDQIEDEVKLLIKDAIFINGKRRDYIPKEASHGWWNRLTFVHERHGIFTMFTKCEFAHEDADLIGLMRSHGYISINWDPILNGGFRYIPSSDKSIVG